MICEKCHGRGFTESGIKCKCKLERELGLYLPAITKGVKLRESIKNKPEISNKNYLIISAVSDYASILKTHLVCRYIENNNYTYGIYNGVILIDAYVGEDSALESIKNLDMLVLELGNDTENKALPSVLSYLLNERFKFNKITWVYISPKNITRIKNLYGQDVYDFIFDSGNFVRVNK